MPTKTISLELDAYDRLRAAKLSPRESFSEVIRRLPIPGTTLTARQLLAQRRSTGPLLSEADLDAIDKLNAEDRPPDIP
ncbi:MAG TPA: antitoxin VapB family protein [Kiritimatiellia bacterium]|nr:antitoxin VapB family protein [Kiritimatiellia bacterium]